jgi:hypothetical protein
MTRDCDSTRSSVALPRRCHEKKKKFELQLTRLIGSGGVSWISNTIDFVDIELR